MADYIKRLWRSSSASSSEPEIHVGLETSSPTLSRRGEDTFSLTLIATLRASRPITVLRMLTLLSTSDKALYEGGFAFVAADGGSADAEALRHNIDLCYDFDDGIALDQKNEELFLELQPGVPCRVEHVFHITPPKEDDDELSGPLSPNSDDASGLEPGCTYRVGLGRQQNVVSWWKYGIKGEVLGHGGKVEDTNPPALTLILDKAVTFKVEG